MLRRSSLAGFTLIELVVTLAIFGFLLALGLPSFATWTTNSKIRTTGAAIQNGLQLAKSEAVRRNALVRFQLTSSLDDSCALSTTGTNWVVSFDNPAGLCGSALLDESQPVSNATANPAPRIIQRRSAAEGGGMVVADADQSAVVFNGLGRSSVAASINLNPAVGACTDYRCLRVTVTTGGQIRMCDPNLPAGDTQAC